MFLYNFNEVIKMNKKKALDKVDEIGRRVLQLHISLLNRKWKFVESDFENIGYCLSELKEIINKIEEKDDGDKK